MQTNNLLDFIIVGAAKCGTSSLSYYLGEHPNIFLPKQQLHFHSRDHGSTKEWEQYEHFFHPAKRGQIIGEHSPFYYTHEKAAQSLSSHYSSAKLIWLLRNPINRTWSHYWYNVMRGSERVTSDHIFSHKRWRDNYVKKSEYSTYVDIYLRYFDIDNMLFVFTEELKESPDKVLSDICNFLGVDSNFKFKRSVEVKRQTVRPKYIWLNRQLKLLHQSRLFHVLGMKKIIEAIINWNRKIGSPYPPMPQDEERKLEEYFKSFNVKLSKQINRDVEEIWLYKY